MWFYFACSFRFFLCFLISQKCKRQSSLLSLSMLLLLNGDGSDDDDDDDNSRMLFLLFLLLCVKRKCVVVCVCFLCVCVFVCVVCRHHQATDNSILICHTIVVELLVETLLLSCRGA